MRSLLQFISAVILLQGVAVVMAANRADTSVIYAGFFASFAAFVLLWRTKATFKELIGLGIAARLLTFFYIPNLSDDIYRFIWDGLCILKGISPFQFLPSELISTFPSTLFENLNSPEYFSLYPPLSQAVYVVGASFYDIGLLTSTNVMRLFLLAFDIGVLYLLRYLLRSSGRPVRLVHWYFLNPLVILEGVGNLHFEVALLFFLLLSLALLRNQSSLSGVAFGVGVLFKTTGLIFLPLLLWSAPKYIRWKLLGVVSVVILAGFAPFLTYADFGHMAESYNLYFQNFEYNGSIYYLLRWIGIQVTGWNQIAIIGPALALISLGCILWVSSRISIPIERRMLFIHGIFLLLSTTVHPWYLLLSIGLMPLTKFRYPLVWSCMIFLTYATYHQEPYREAVSHIWFEYGLVAIFFAYELWKSRKQLT